MPTETVAAAAAAPPRVSVLFVDDERVVLRAIARSLAQSPYEVLTAVGAGEAMALLEQRQVDVLVSDIDMPDMSGIELVQIARRDHPEMLRMLLTGHATLDRALQAINHGEVLRFFNKPFEPVVFLDEMEALEERVRSQREAREQHAKDARLHDLDEWLEASFPGALAFARNDEGEVSIDLLAVLADLDDGRLPAAAKDLLRKEA